MALNIPSSSKEVVQRSKTDVQRELPTSNPFLRNSAISAIVTATAKRIFDFYRQLTEALQQMIWVTSTDEFLENWASIFGITRNAATPATGTIVVTGTAPNSVPSGTEFSSSDGLLYSSVDSATLVFNLVSAASLSRIGTTATLTVSSPHQLASGMTIPIGGADQPEYNGSFVITVISETAFTYDVLGSPATPATGTILYGWTGTSVNVESVGFGSATNQENGAVLTLVSPLTGVDSDGHVDLDGIGGGTDEESDTELRARFLDRVQNPVANFNVSAIESVARTVPGVTRVWVLEITPEVGQVTIYFTRDNDEGSNIPNGSEIADVKNAILSIKPAHTADADVIVEAPTAVPVDFTFTSVVPNTPTMQEAINANLKQFFDEETEVGVNLESDAYRSVIFNTIDTKTGDRVVSFDLSEPTTDITIQQGQLPTIGSIVYQ